MNRKQQLAARDERRQSRRDYLKQLSAAALGTGSVPCRGDVRRAGDLTSRGLPIDEVAAQCEENNGGERGHGEGLCSVTGVVDTQPGRRHVVG